MSNDRPLRVLHLTAGSDAGGVSRYLFDLCTAMQERGHDVRIAGEHGAWRELFAGAPFPWIDLPLKGNVLDLWHSARRLREILREFPADLIHAHYRRATLVARRLQDQSKPPILYTLHQPGISLAGPRRWLSDFGEFVHVPSEEAFTWMVESARVPPQKITLIHHGVCPELFPVADDAQRANARKELNLPATATIAAFVGRLDVPKNEDWFLDVALAAKHRLPQAHFVIAGDGPHEPQVRERIAREGLSDRVTLLGYREPLPVYHAADALLVPSLREGFCFSALEALCAGVAVLRTNTGGTLAQIIPGITGESTEVNREAFIDAAINFLADPQSLKKMGQSAAVHVRNTLTYDLQVERTIALYRRIAGGSQ